MKTKFSKPIIIGSTIFIITILAIIGIAISSNNKPENKNTFEIVTEIDDVRVSGNINKVAKINIDIITKDKKEYSEYSEVIHNIEHLLDTNKLNDIMFIKVVILNENGKEITLDEPMTIYLDNLYIDIHSSLFDKFIINKDNSLTAYDMTIINYPNNIDETYSEGTVVYFDITKSATFAIISYFEKDEETKDVFKEVEITKDKTDDESALNTVNKDYKVEELTSTEIKEKYGINNSNLSNSINYINKLDGIILQKYETDQNAMDGSEEDFNIVSSDDALVFLYSKMDNTKNYLTGEKENFEEVFGFNYKNCNGAFDVFDSMLKNMGLNIDYENVEFNKQWYAVTKECTYDLKEKDEIVKTAFPNLKYDSIEDTIVNYELGVYYDPVLKQNIYNINQVSIVVYYKTNDVTRMRSLVLSATYTTEKIINEYYINGEIGLQ